MKYSECNLANLVTELEFHSEDDYLETVNSVSLQMLSVVQNHIFGTGQRGDHIRLVAPSLQLCLIKESHFLLCGPIMYK